MRRDAILTTERLTLEPLAAAHAASLYPLLRDPGLYTFLPIDAPQSADALAQRYAALSAGRSPDGKETWLNWVLRLGASPDAYVGTVQATIFESGVALIAYSVFPQFSGKGIAQEAVRAMLRFLFESCGVGRAEALIDTRNWRSIRVVEALGFARCEIIPEADHFKGSRSDEYRYALTRGPI